jgi:hypothetical protein
MANIPISVVISTIKTVIAGYSGTDEDGEIEVVGVGVGTFRLGA